MLDAIVYDVLLVYSINLRVPIAPTTSLIIVLDALNLMPFLTSSLLKFLEVFYISSNTLKIYENPLSNPIEAPINQYSPISSPKVPPINIAVIMWLIVL